MAVNIRDLVMPTGILETFITRSSAPFFFETELGNLAFFSFFSLVAHLA